jgi:hypothetical protein
MKSLSSSSLKLAIRLKIQRATGCDPGRVHPGFLLTASKGGIRTNRIPHDPAAGCSLAVHFLPVDAGPSTRWISFNLN